MAADTFRKTYEMRHDAPEPMPVERYLERVSAEWTSLLRSEPIEPQIQAFLEAHAVMVPGAHLGIGRITATGHAPFPHALIAQPPLRGLTTRIPDFLWLASDSLVFNPVFVEIEAPGKRWVTDRGRQHHQLTEALDQIIDWRDWLAKPVNREIFLEAYQVPRQIRERQWEPVFVLIYGRKAENPGAVARVRRNLLESDVYTVPYENLAPEPDSANYPCIRCGPDGFRAVAVPPTLRLSPHSAENWLLIKQKQEAIRSSAWMSVERREFLIERVSYWDEWARREPRGIRSSGDFE